MDAEPYVTLNQLVYSSRAVDSMARSIIALGFPSKTSAEIAPDHLKLSQGTSRGTMGDSAQTRINIAVFLY